MSTKRVQNVNDLLSVYLKMVDYLWWSRSFHFSAHSNFHLLSRLIHGSVSGTDDEFVHRARVQTGKTKHVDRPETGMLL